LDLIIISSSHHTGTHVPGVKYNSRQKNNTALYFRFFIINIVNDYILTQVTGFGEKDAPVVQTRHPIDKEAEVFPAGQHERVASELA